ncbi:MAG: 23S rRNA (pseudouridine(1915)-N(3))-methyltransferase RlmH [Sphingobium sp.]|nr:23S rRNA (pseudouridine(1915)-N(3))-methyltransferase RlmH [Sphingobium sp.]
MLLHIIARGRIGRSSEAELVERYLKRVTWPTKVTELPDRGGPGRGKAPPTALSPAISIMLDEGGQQLTSMAFAERLGRWRDDGMRECRFLIGAADGFTDDERNAATLRIAFGAMTWPHMMARAMLAEQLWRATSILANHPYHREG